MQKIVPHLWYNKEAKEAAAFYTSVFPDSKIVSSSTITGTSSGDCDILSIDLCGQRFMMISAGPLFSFTPAVSFIVNCDTQEEIDHYWEKLSAVPEAEQCGWLQDKFGLSWQIVPTAMQEMMSGGDQEKIARVTQAFMKMKKFNIAELQKAADGI